MISGILASAGSVNPVKFFRRIGPGLTITLIVGAAALFIAEHYGAPAMLLALLLGMALNFLAEEPRCADGIAFTARTVLRFGVALLGARISLALLVELGGDLIVLTALGVIATIAFGMVLSRFLGRGWVFGILSGGAVAICGVSAAMAIIVVLPKDEDSERNLIFTVLSVTLLSTVAMVVYPILAHAMGLSDDSAGVFLGGTIHDVAQVVGAGYSVSEETGNVATLVKLLRVAMLAPVVLTISMVFRHRGRSVSGKRPPLLPLFVVGFLILAALNSVGAFPGIAIEIMTELSRYALLIAIAAVGMKTSLRDILEVKSHAIVLIVAETLFVAAFVLGGLLLLGL